jgi:ribosomal-protein-alanine acetyltransferase
MAGLRSAVRDPARDWLVAPGSDRDLPELCALSRAAIPEPWSERALAEEIARPGGTLWIARGRPGNALLGFLLGYTAVGELHILTLGVDPGRRRVGIGTALVRAVLGEARAAAVACAHLEVRASNDPARALYQGLGFVVVGRRPRYYRDGEDALLMSLDLRSALPAS